MGREQEQCAGRSSAGGSEQGGVSSLSTSPHLLSISPPLHLPIFPSPIHLSTYPPIHLSISLPLHLHRCSRISSTICGKPCSRSASQPAARQPVMKSARNGSAGKLLQTTQRGADWCVAQPSLPKTYLDWEIPLIRSAAQWSGSEQVDP